MNLLLFNLSVDRDDTALGFTTDWINELAKHVDSISVITMYAGRVEVAPNVTVLSAGRERRLSKPRRVIEFYRHLQHVLRTRRIDACFAHMMPLFAVLAWPMLRLRGIPTCLWYAHNHPSRMLRIANVLIDVPVTSFANAYPVRNSRLKVIGQGIDTSTFFAAPERQPGGPVLFYTLGRISAVKRLDVLVEAFRLFLASRPATTAEFHIIGDCLSPADEQYRATLLEQIHSSGVHHAVHIKPSVPFRDAPLIHRSGDVFLHSNENGLDKALLEAMSCGNPVIACHPAVAFALGEWSARAPADIAARMGKLHDLPPDLRRDIGMGLRQFVIDQHSLGALGLRISGILKAMAAASPLGVRS